jgi:hypothetical protein
MIYNQEIKDNIDKWTKDHQLEIIKDDGVYRHIRFGKPDSVIYSYNLITWPGHLCFTGDIGGTFVFSRVEDMFTFFNHDDINPSYWSEKVKAGITEEFSYKKFEEAVYSYLDNDEYTDEELEEINADIKDHLLYVDQNEIRCFDWAMDYSFHFPDGRHFEFCDFWENNCREYTFSFIVTCYAIVKAVKEYYDVSS